MTLISLPPCIYNTHTDGPWLLWHRLWRVVRCSRLGEGEGAWKYDTAKEGWHEKTGGLLKVLQWGSDHLREERGVWVRKEVSSFVSSHIFRPFRSFGAIVYGYTVGLVTQAARRLATGRTARSRVAEGWKSWFTPCPRIPGVQWALPEVKTIERRATHPISS